MTRPTHPPVSVGAATVGDLTCRTDAQGQTQCEVGGGDDGPCVDGRNKRWVSPGDQVHGVSADIAEVFTDGGQSWARLTNGNVVPMCTKTTPPSATRVPSSPHGVSVGQVQPMPNQSPPSGSPDLTSSGPAPSQPGVSPQDVCAPGWTLAGDGTCVPPDAIATPDPDCPPGHYLKESGDCVPIDFDPRAPEEGADPQLPEMAPDMPPSSTPGPTATFDAKTGKLVAPGTPFDGMEVQPYGQGVCPDNYNGGKRAVFFGLGHARMYATITKGAGDCCGACAVGGACSGCSEPGGPDCACAQKNPGAFPSPNGSVRMRMGTPQPSHTKVATRDHTTKVLVADEGYMLSLYPLKQPLDGFKDAYGRMVYLGRKVFTAPGLPQPPRSTMGAPVSVGAARQVNPQVITQGPQMNPGAGPGIGPAIGQQMAGLPPRNPEWRPGGFPGPLDGVKM